MEKVISAADANRKFSRLLSSVRQGNSYVVTSHGRRVAKIVPSGEGDPWKDKARSVLLARLRSQPIVKAGKWKREELYEDGQ